jgi:hypothetical protein
MRSTRTSVRKFARATSLLAKAAGIAKELYLDQKPPCSQPFHPLFGVPSCEKAPPVDSQIPSQLGVPEQGVVERIGSQPLSLLTRTSDAPKEFAMRSSLKDGDAIGNVFRVKAITVELAVGVPANDQVNTTSREAGSQFHISQHLRPGSGIHG